MFAAALYLTGQLRLSPQQRCPWASLAVTQAISNSLSPGSCSAAREDNIKQEHHTRPADSPSEVP